MKYFSSCLFYFLPLFINGQDSTLCKVEIYLIKRSIATSDSAYLTNSLKRFDLEDSPLIRNSQILLYTFRNFKEEVSSGVMVTRKIHTIKTSNLLTDVIDNNSLQNSKGNKFALVLNDRILYWGYLSSILSSIVPEAKIFAKITNNEFELCYSIPQTTESKDPRENDELFNCLTDTKRFEYSTTTNAR